MSGNRHRLMRRSERQVTDPKEIQGILAESPVVSLAIHDEPAPYVVPLFFGHEDGRLYVHSALSGTKIRLLHADPRVGFTAWTPAEIVEGGDACSFSARARSVAGTGVARIVEDEKERMHGLDLIMRHSTGREAGFAYDRASVSRTLVIAVDIVAILGKRTENRPESPRARGAGQQVR
ncbi:MAG TPA: pyridoxamine 5'-phosphate oxidase family protein [Spirochaetia bacterium]|nr:pyridoxamine 5'-phosphate oxidase family protein [Spirochaetia bacterium]